MPSQLEHGRSRASAVLATEWAYVRRCWATARRCWCCWVGGHSWATACLGGKLLAWRLPSLAWSPMACPPASAAPSLAFNHPISGSCSSPPAATMRKSLGQTRVCHVHQAALLVKFCSGMAGAWSIPKQHCKLV